MNIKKVLIVDDSATARMIVRKCLEIAGLNNCKFMEAENGLHALSILAEFPADLVVTDINMPKMDGNTFIRQLKNQEQFADIPVIVISSLNKNNIQTDLVYMGEKGIITKPISPARIKELLYG